MASTYARLMNQCENKNQTIIFAKFDRQDEDNQVLDETNLFKILNNNQNLTESDIGNTDIKS